jgi:hypothetical protein
MKLLFGLFTISMASIFQQQEDTPKGPGRSTNFDMSDIMQNMINSELDMNHGPPPPQTEEEKNDPTRSGWQGNNGLVTVDEVVDQVTSIQVSPLEIQKFKICVERFNRQASHAEKDEQMSEVQQWLASEWSKFGSWFCGADYKCWKSYVFVLKKHVLPKSHLMVKKCLKKQILPEYRK